LTKRKMEYCVSNEERGSGEVAVLVQQQFPDVRVKRWGCLGYCHLCIHNPYVLIDDVDYLEAPTAAQLWEQVKAKLSHPVHTE
jgi:uncharacterized protein YuzB (UPF0349 family)